MHMSEVFRRRSAGPFRVLFLVAALVGLGGEVLAGGFFRNGAVGGIAIDAEGVVREPTAEATEALRQALQERLQVVPTEMGPMNLRKISLRQLEAALQDAADKDLGALPDELKYLAGIQRVQYVLVYPDRQDVVLAGPGEGWVIGEQGAIVGQTTGRPVIKLEDLLVALHATRTARETGISCSIDPTEEGIRAMREFVSRQRTFTPGVLDGIQQALGAPTNHPDRRVRYVALRPRAGRRGLSDEADRYAVKDPPVPELPSFLQLLAASRYKPKNLMPRWWMACNYEPLARGEDGMAWELRSTGVKVMTEDDFVTDQGDVTTTGEQNPIAARWAEAMNQNYEKLSARQPVFGQLRNLMDLCVIAALIDQEQLLDRAGCELPILTGENGDFLPESWNPPKTVSSQCSVMKRGSGIRHYGIGGRADQRVSIRFPGGDQRRSGCGAREGGTPGGSLVVELIAD